MAKSFYSYAGTSRRDAQSKMKSLKKSYGDKFKHKIVHKDITLGHETTRNYFIKST